MNLNKVLLVGRLTKQPELKSTKSGKGVTSFSIATNRTWKDKSGQEQGQVEFHNIVAFGVSAENLAKYCVKGSLLLVEGRLQTREWEAKDKTKRRTTEVIVERFQFGPKPKGVETAPPAEEVPPPSDNSTQSAELDVGGEIQTGDLPF